MKKTIKDFLKENKPLKSKPELVLTFDDYLNFVTIFICFGADKYKIKALAEKTERWLNSEYGSSLGLENLAKSLYEKKRLPNKNTKGLNFKISKILR